MSLLLAVTSASKAAEIWTGCEAITAVSNYIATSNQVTLFVSPAISGCSGGIAFTEGQDNVSSSNINTFLATAIAAFLSAQKVTIYYDNSTGACNGAAISLNAGCP